MAAVLLMPLTAITGCGATEHAVRPSAAGLVGVKRVAVVVQGDSAFEVVAARAKAGTAMELVRGDPFLLLGLSVALAVTAGIKGAAALRDSNDASALQPPAQTFSPRAVLVDTFSQSLRSGGRFEVENLETEPTAEQRPHFDAVVFLRVPLWGFQLLRTDDPWLAAFVQIDAKVVRTGRSESLWEQTETVFGRGRQTPDALKADPELVRRELKETLETAGHRLAVELLYPRDGKP